MDKSTLTQLRKETDAIKKQIQPDEYTQYDNMTPEQRQHRIAELFYKGLVDTDPRVMKMTEQEFVTLYLSSGPKERHALCGYPESISNDELLDRLRSQMQYEESR